MAALAAELARRYLEELGALPLRAWLAVLTALGAAIAGMALRPARPRRAFVWAAAVGFAACVAIWSLLAWQQRWACDDAFISFRYARNWVEGHGLVYNLGERVEGYTNFLWTALVALGLLLRVDPVLTTVVLGFGSALFALSLAWKLSRDLAPARALPLIAPGVVLLAGSRLFAQYTTSGLETMFAASLSLFALERAVNGRRFAAGCAGILATMAHPDHGLAYAALGLSLVLEPSFRSASWKGRRDFLLPYVAPFVLVYLPYLGIKAAYYGSLVPNTYYAKSAGEAYFSQGFQYIAISGLAAGFVGALPLVLTAVVVLRHTLLVRYFVVLVLGYLPYVAKIGGDFMLGRLFVLVLLPTAVLVDVGARTLWHAGGRLRRSLCVLGMTLAMSLVVPTSVVHDSEKYHHVADEATFYRLRKVAADGVESELTDIANDLNRALKRARERPTLVTGCLGIIGYLTGLRIIDVFGLTDAHVAHQPLLERGRPGHEKWISKAYAIQSGGDFSETEVFPERYGKFVEFRVGGRKYNLIAHRPGLIAELEKGRHVRPPRTKRLLSQYRGVPDRAQQDCDLWFFDTLYFRYHPQAELEAFVQRLVGKQRLDPALASFYAVSAGRQPAGFARVRSFELDAPVREGFRGTGDVATAWSARKGPIRQAEVGNARGGFIDSFTESQEDTAVGELRSPEFVVQGDVIELYVAGGNRDQVEVVLEVDGTDVARATGCDLELLGRRLWNVAPYKGRRALIRIVDHNRGGWGHIIVDRITEWRAPAAPNPALEPRAVGTL